MLVSFLGAAILGFKHALDPDHIAATLNMTLSGQIRGRSAAKLGAMWGVGHTLSMVLLGLPVILFSAAFPAYAYTYAELLIGLVITYLGAKLLVEWFKGKFHPHEIMRLKDKGEAHNRSHVKSGLMGMLHGVGGSYPAALLMLASFNTPLSAALGLLVFTALSVVSMSLTTVAFSLSVFNHTMMHILDRLLMPIFIVLTIVFGIHYIQGAAGALGIL